MEILYKKKKYLYPLVIILEELVLYCYGPSVISVTVIKGGHLRGSRLYRTSGTIGRGVAELRS